MKTKSDIRKLLIMNLPCVVFGFLMSNIGEAWRLTEGVKESQRFMAFIEMIPEAFANPLPGFCIEDIAFGIAAAVLLRLVIAVRGSNQKKYRHGREYGSARWGTRKDIEPFIDSDPRNNVILTATESLTMNSRPKDPGTARNKNVLVVGGSGSGKTRFFIKPNILQCDSELFPVSLVLSDPKSELLRTTGKLLQQKGFEVRYFNVLDFSHSFHYNPFAYIHSEKDILKLVTVLMANTKGEGKTSDPFWEKAETLLYTALIGYIHYECPMEEQNITTLLDMLNSMEVREDDEDFLNAVDYQFEALKRKDPDHFAVRQYTKFKQAAAKTLKSILISCGARLAPFDIKEVREVMENDELQLDQIGDRKTALFLIMSDNDSTFNFLIAMIYTQLFNLLCERADQKYGGRLPVHVRCLIDEAANVGQIPNLEKLMATVRSREISISLVLQAKSQLKAIYKDNADTIIGNMDAQLFLGGTEPGTLKDLAEALGKETIDYYNTSDTRGSSLSYGTNWQKLGKDLLSRDELAVLDGKKCILQLRGVRPFLSDKYDYTKHPNYGLTGDANVKALFDPEKESGKRLKLTKDDPFVVIEQ